MEDVEVVVAHHERATLRAGEVFLKIDADLARTDAEVEAMTLAPIPTPDVLWRKPPVLALAALPGSALGRLGEPSTASTGSADVHLLLAGMAVAARRGLGDPESLELAERLSSADHDDFEHLPTSCAQSADALDDQRAAFEADGVFPAELIDLVLDQLRAKDDAAPMKKVARDDGTRAELVRRYWHVG